MKDSFVNTSYASIHRVAPLKDNKVYRTDIHAMLFKLPPNRLALPCPAFCQNKGGKPSCVEYPHVRAVWRFMSLM